MADPMGRRTFSSKETKTHAGIKALANAVDEYGDGERAHRTAIVALKREYEKVGNRWAAKKRRGPSDPRAASARARENVGEDFGGALQRARPRHSGTLEDEQARARARGRTQAAGAGSSAIIELALELGDDGKRLRPAATTTRRRR